MSTPTSMDARTWFVTGASSGLGWAVAVEALDQGDRVVATARDLDRLAGLPETSQAAAIRLDVRDPEAARDVFAEAVGRFERVDVVFNNAGHVGTVGAVEEVSDDDLRDVIETDLFGAINVTRAALPHLRTQRSGRLLQISSLNGVEGLPGGAFYAASKFGVEGFSESLAAEVAPLGVSVTIIEPGPHRTGLLGKDKLRWAPELADYQRSVGAVREQLRRMDGVQPGDPAEAARAIVRVAHADNPPRRLPVGPDVVDAIRAKLTAQLEELERLGG